MNNKISGLLALASGVALAAIITTAAIGSQPVRVGGYDGWWNATPASGDVRGLPLETVTVDTNTGEIIDAFNRAKNDTGQTTLVSDVDFDVVPDPAWPRNTIVVIDTATGDVIEQFPARGTSG